MVTELVNDLKVLRKVRRLLTTGGLSKFVLREGARGSPHFCLNGAINMASRGDPSYAFDEAHPLRAELDQAERLRHALTDDMTAQFADRLAEIEEKRNTVANLLVWGSQVEAAYVLADFNNHVDTTLEEVVNLLDLVIADLEVVSGAEVYLKGHVA